MFNFIKWELKDYFKKSYIYFVVIGIVFGIILLLPYNDFTRYIFSMASFFYLIIMLVSFYGSYYLGTGKVVRSFSKKTFLLESMIPLSPKKILLSKYLIGLIINTLFLLIALLGIIILAVRAAGLQSTFETLKNIIEYINFENFVKFSITMFLISLAFLSLIVLLYIIIKVLLPNTSDTALVIVVGVIAFYNFGYFVYLFKIDNLYIIWLILMIITVASYFITSFLIERKLEIYD